ncbi:dihydrolipoyl dehydrogenase family protein [Streptomyces spiramenti]|uniref:NAD(P)/FAD-dependent oxidoreductase n=1 Tax=Streptomyces spiramenti TaxID=2720606 RepID=A0ABX1ART4_9ACTN|nr:NAD(P)/FAD-dependent oxidoreductase [Streptomyces spiramenti]NJP69040.1 NAD(P)/FAD-dependent oxidoreductase [Streptomyces spiramenti]
MAEERAQDTTGGGGGKTARGAAETADVHDVVVVGAGPVGEVLAGRVSQAGLSVVIVENELVGGECSYWACMPSKALLRPAAALSDARAVAGARQAVDGPLDAAAVLARRDDFTHDWDDSSQVEWLDSVGVPLVRGVGRLAGELRVAVETSDGSSRVLTARHAVAVCTGSRALVPDLPGVAEARPWTSRNATSASEVPGRLAVVGGGVVGVEMATAWQALGSRVTVLARGDALLPRMEPFAGELVARSLRDAGADVRTGTSVTALRRPDPGGPVTVVLDDGGEVEVDEVLLATGRGPRTEDLGLVTVGLEPGDWLRVDDSCRVDEVAGGWLYAVGDVNGRALLTHQGKYQARVAGDAVVARVRGEAAAGGRWGAHAATADDEAVSQVVFSHPEVASVGLTASDAESRGIRVRIADADLGAVAGASLYADGYQGHARLVADADRGVLVGATFAGPAVTEMLHAATVAVVAEVPVERLAHAVPAYPTISEVWLGLLAELRD